MFPKLFEHFGNGTNYNRPGGPTPVYIIGLACIVAILLWLVVIGINQGTAYGI